MKCIVSNIDNNMTHDIGLTLAGSPDHSSDLVCFTSTHQPNIENEQRHFSKQQQFQLCLAVLEK